MAKSDTSLIFDLSTNASNANNACCLSFTISCNRFWDTSISKNLIPQCNIIILNLMKNPKICV
ncbi:hypothetical protein ACHAXS_001120 [Conticribra weissflogii]